MKCQDRVTQFKRERQSQPILR